LVSIPFREWEGGYLAVRGWRRARNPWAALVIPFGERDASLTNLEDSKRIYCGVRTRTSPKKSRNVLSCIWSVLRAWTSDRIAPEHGFLHTFPWRRGFNVV